MVFILFVPLNKLPNEIDAGTGLNNDIDMINEQPISPLKTSDSWSNFSYIHITGANWSIAAGYEWCTGSGTALDPYVIENITMDASSTPTGSGIYIENSNLHFIIRNCTIFNVPNILGDSYEGGIRLENTSNGTIISNNCSYNTYDSGISLYSGCKNITVEDNILIKNFKGIYVRSNNENITIKDNIALNNTNGYYIQTNIDINLYGNLAANSTARGFFIWTSTNCTLDGNQAIQNRGSGDGEGILIQAGGNHTISNNWVHLNVDQGIELYGSDNNTIIGNLCSNNSQGIYLNSAESNLIKKNQIENNTDGIQLTSNSISNNFTMNVIINNTNNGILIDFGCVNNIITKNAFLENGQHAYDDAGSNFNDWFYNGVGNYWDNVSNQADNNGDGICDYEDYEIEGSNGRSDDFLTISGDPRYNGSIIHVDDAYETGRTWQWMSTRLYVDGDGTEDVPYLIEEIEIDAGGSGSCVLLGNSTKYFEIKSCNITNSGTLDSPDFDAGIKIDNCTNGAFINNNISNNNYGLYASALANCSFSYNTFYQNSDNGLYLSGVLTCNFSNNEIIESGGDGVSIVGYSQFNYFEKNNVFRSQSEGIYIGWSNNNTFYSNNISFNFDDGIYILHCGNNTFSFDTISYNEFHGIFIDKQANLFTDRNKFLNCSVTYNNYSGVYIDGVSTSNLYYTEISGCNISYNGQDSTSDDKKCGITIQKRISNSTIMWNVLNNNRGYGLYFNDRIDDNSIESNQIICNQLGGVFSNDICQDNAFLSNNISINEGYGIWLNVSQGGFTIQYNTIGNNSLDGIFSHFSYSNYILNNTICFNQRYGINSNYSDSQEMNGNHIYNNTIRGMYLYQSNLTIIQFNTFENQSNHIYLNQTSWCDIKYNTFLPHDNYIVYENCYANYVSDNYDEDGAPNININAPLDSSNFGLTSPNFDITIVENNLNYTWYTLINATDSTDNITRFFSYEVLIQINQADWGQFENGSIVIRFYANDTIGAVNYSEVQVNKDIIAPTINIIAPNQGDLYGNSSPNFDVSISDPNLQYRWYTLNGGPTTFFGGSTGIVNATDWNNQPNGTVSIRFMANDTLGNLATVEVNVSKDMAPPNITINAPNAGNLYDATSPTFDINIEEGNLNATWYVLINETNPLHNRSNLFIYLVVNQLSTSDWNSFGNGSIRLLFYANDTLGNIFYSEVLIHKDVIAPELTSILLPSESSTAPVFTLTINEANLNQTWYTVNAGTTKYFFTELTDSIDADLWESLSTGNHVIEFFANDSMGNLDSKIIVIKKIETPNQPTSPDDPLMIIIIIIIGAAIVVGGFIYSRSKGKKGVTVPSKKQLQIKSKRKTLGSAAASETPKGGVPPKGAKAPKGVKGKGKGGEEADAGLTAAEEEELAKTEEEVAVDEQKMICVVHKGPIDGAIYACPKCKTFYCMKCAQTLKEKGEHCWSCEKEFNI